MAERAGKMNLKTWFDAERQLEFLQIEEGEKVWAHVTLELPELTDLLRDLGKNREMFAEPVPFTLDPGTRVDAHFHPAWRVQPLTTAPRGVPAGSVLLQLRHPGFGWLSFVLPPHEAQALARALHSPPEQ